MGDTAKLLAIFFGVSAVCLFPIGVLIGWYTGPDRVDSTITAARRECSTSIKEQLMDIIDSNEIADSLRSLTTDTHIAASQTQYGIAQKIRDEFRAFGVDKVEIRKYDVLLSSPSEDSVVQILVPDSTQPGRYIVEFESTLNEPLLDENSHGKSIAPAFSAYSKSGTEEGELVYANYASLDDFQHLINDKGIDISGKIVIARYGKLYLGDKAKFAAEFGAKGLILYSDPADYQDDEELVYPEGRSLPTHAILRGSLLEEIGDPLTPDFPADESAYRINTDSNDQLNLPSIPVHPVSSDDAFHFLSKLRGDRVKKGWTGNIPDVTYRYGPGFSTSYQNGIVNMSVINKNSRKDTWNVIGTLFGGVEPDRYVAVGCHSDAWAFGAVDPSSGTAVLLEVARAFGKFKTNGLRPRRSIIFASWGAGEFGQIGSNEWVEENSKFLSSSLIAYLNIDSVVAGTFVPEFWSTPNLHNIIWEAVQQVPDPDPAKFTLPVDTVYDRWLLRSKVSDDLPTIGDLSSGSDFTPFLQISGVSALHFSFVRDKTSTTTEPFPLRHSIYDTHDLFHRLYDPESKYLQASARIVAEITRVISDSKVIPLSCSDYSVKIDEYYKGLRFGELGLKMVSEGMLTFSFMEDAVANLVTKATFLDNYIANELDKSDILAVRAVNDILMNFERYFIAPRGLPGRPAIRHMIYAPSSRDQYVCDIFAGIVDTMFDIDNNDDPDKWEYVAQELAAVTYVINAAARSMDISWIN